MSNGVPRLDDRSCEEWLEQASRFEKMAERFHHDARLSSSFSALARDAIVRAKDRSLTEARVMGEADWRQAQRTGRTPQASSANVEYFRRREAQERIDAVQSSDVRVRRVHLEMAIRYRALATNAGAAEPSGSSLHLK